MTRSRRVSEKRNESTHKKSSGGGAHGGCCRHWEICEIKFAQGNMTWTCWDLSSIFYDFAQQASSFVRSTAACSATFRQGLLRQLLNPYYIISTVTALQAVAKLEVACLLFVVPSVMSIYLSTDPAAAGFVYSNQAFLGVNSRRFWESR